MTQTLPPSASGPITPSPRGVRALREFFRLEAAGGIVLIAAAVLAMAAANSPLSPTYEAFRQLPVEVRIGAFDIAKPLLLWINDGLMAVFFLLVALEIKREMVEGQFSDRSQVALPAACALGGMMVPMGILWFFNRTDPVAMAGVAIPAATDIAFALG